VGQAKTGLESVSEYRRHYWPIEQNAHKALEIVDYADVPFAFRSEEGTSPVK